MSVTKLSVGHKEQIKSMMNDGKKAKEIIAFFKDQYGFDLIPWQVYALKKKPNNSDTTQSEPQKRTYKKRKTEGAIEKIVLPEGVLPSAEPIIEEIRTFKTAYMETLKFIRLELIKSRCEIYDLKKDD